MRTVLLVDDETAILRLFGNALKRAGFNVLAAGNGREALEAFEKDPGQIDLLVTDVVMPEMDGFSMARQALAQKPELPVLFISAVVQEAEIPGIRSCADCRFIRKPCAPSTLVATVKEMLGLATRTAAG
jgi:two-component system cell cycle sensor histidine kinase/response regulator CckA